MMFAVLLAGCSQSERDSYDPGLPPPRSEIAKYVSHELAIDAFLNTYWRYKPNKAFASSDDGVYGYSAEQMSSAGFAEKSALTYCDKYRENGRYPSLCKVVNVNGRWQVDPPAR